MNHNRAQTVKGLKEPVYLAITAVVLAISHLAVTAQASSNGVPISNRYLLLVETSKSMQHRTNGTLEAIQNLLLSGMRGQLHSNDSLGVWTFNASLNAGKFPLQKWTGLNQKVVAASVADFLREQKYEKRPDFTPVMPAVENVIKNSEFLTIVLFSSGESLIHGTPVDDKVNKYFQGWRKEQEKAHMPFVTVLRAEKGHIVDSSVNSAPWPVEMPPLATELKMAFEAKPPPPPPPPPKPAPVAPLIVIGKKSQPAGTLNFSGPATNQAAESRPSAPTVRPLQSNPMPGSNQVTPHEDFAGTVKTEASPSVLPESHPVPAQVPPVKPQVETQQEPVAVASNPPVQPVPTQTEPQAGVTNAPVVVDSRPAPAAPAAETATTVPTDRGFGGVLIWLIPIAIFLLAGCVFLLLRRSHSNSHGSLITRSFDRGND